MTTPTAVCWLVRVSVRLCARPLRELRQAKIQNLDAAFFGDENVFGLQVTMDDSLVVRRRQSMGDLNSIFDRLTLGQGAAVERDPQGFTFQKFGNQKR